MESRPDRDPGFVSVCRRLVVLVLLINVASFALLYYFLQKGVMRFELAFAIALANIFFFAMIPPAKSFKTSLLRSTPFHGVAAVFAGLGIIAHFKSFESSKIYFLIAIITAFSWLVISLVVYFAGQTGNHFEHWWIQRRGRVGS